MKIGDREVVPTKLGWVDAETGVILVNVRGLSIPKDQPKAKKTKKAAKVEEPVVESSGEVVEESVAKTEVVAEVPAEVVEASDETREIEAPKKSKKTKNSKKAVE